MAAIDIAIAKMHLRVDSDIEDDYIKSLISAAIKFAQKYIGKTIVNEDETPPDGVIDPLVMDDDLQHGLLMLVGYWYENRETVNIGNIVNELPMASAAIFDMYRSPTL